MRLPEQRHPSGTLSFPRARLALAAFALAPAITLSLRKDGLDKTLRRLERVPAWPPWKLEVDHRATEHAAGLAFRALPILGGKCLERSLLQFALHRLTGRGARFVIGVRRDAHERFNAHAWVEDDGGCPAHATSFAPVFARETS